MSMKQHLVQDQCLSRAVGSGARPTFSNNNRTNYHVPQGFAINTNKQLNKHMLLSLSN